VQQRAGIDAHTGHRHGAMPASGSLPTLAVEHHSVSGRQSWIGAGPGSQPDLRLFLGRLAR
jgi:hypothetical protein